MVHLIQFDDELLYLQLPLKLLVLGLVHLGEHLGVLSTFGDQSRDGLLAGSILFGDVCHQLLLHQHLVQYAELLHQRQLSSLATFLAVTWRHFLSDGLDFIWFDPL
jgi:hypothetical protein